MNDIADQNNMKRVLALGKLQRILATAPESHAPGLDGSDAGPYLGDWVGDDGEDLRSND